MFNASMLRVFALMLLITSECNGFAAKKGGGKQRRKASVKQGGPTGFGVATQAQKREQSSSDQTETQEIVLGPDKRVCITVPPNTLSPDKITTQELEKFSKDRTKLLDEYGAYRGRGDVIWPSSLHLSRLIANCPSFVNERKVIDLGCGLGLASLATLLGKPTRLALSDIDDEVLDLAVRSCKENIKAQVDPSIQSVERLKLDWADSSTWPSNQGDFDVVLASDVLYDKEAAKHLSDLIAHLLMPADEGGGGKGKDDDIIGRALIVDPENRENRGEFVVNAARQGLIAEVAPFPGQEDFCLINVTPA